MDNSIVKSNVCDQIVAKLKKAIINGELKPGDQLPNERQMAEDFGVSRVPLREALRSLRQMGILITKHGQGTFVNQINSDFLINNLSSYLILGQKPVIEVLEIRKILETEAAALAAKRATLDDIETIKYFKNQVLSEKEKYEKGMGGDISAADMKFHLAIANASQNSVFAKFIDMIREPLAIHQRWNASEAGALDQVVLFHEGIYKGIKDRNPQEASEMMRRHLEEIEENIVKTLLKRDNWQNGAEGDRK
jgi:Transcriptional regulators